MYNVWNAESGDFTHENEHSGKWADYPKYLE